MKIAIFHLAFIYSGGGEKLVLEEAKGLMKRGHEVTIFAPVIDRKRCFPDVINEFPVKTLLPTLPGFLPEWESFQILLTCVLAPFLAYRFRNCDVILAANQPSPWLVLWVKKFFGVPYLAYLAQPTRFLYPRKIDLEAGLRFVGKGAFSPAAFLMGLARPFVNWADQVSIKGADLILGNGEYVKELLEKTYGIKAVSCPAGAYPVAKPASYADRFSGTLKIAAQTISKPYILLTNRHFPQKRFEYAISAMPMVLKDNPDVSLVITGGETSYTRGLKTLVKQLSLEDKVLFLGLVKESDLEKLYANAAVYVYTAPEEDFGMGVVEAMAHGTLVIAWNAAGPSKIIKDGKTGLLVTPYEAPEFADKMEWALTEQKFAEKIGKQAWEEVKKKFSYKDHVDVLEEGFSDALKDHK